MGQLATVEGIKGVVVTLKTCKLVEQNRWTLDVDPHLNKTQIRQLVESTFGVQVLAVNTHMPPRRRRALARGGGYLPRYKRAIVTLRQGDTLVSDSE